jgi:hypothetical protein
VTTLFHVTTARRLGSILAKGLLTRYARGKLRAVWLVRRPLVWWALAHVAGRHKVGLQDLVALELRVPKGWLKRHPGKLLYTTRDIPPGRVVQVLTLAALTATPTG